MNALASLKTTETQSSLGTIMEALRGHDGLPLRIRYAEREAQSGYHITEVKAGSFVTLDCGGNPDAWQETVLQVEDIPNTDGSPMMTAGKFTSILGRVDRQVRLNYEARLTIEVGRPGEAMRVFDVAGLTLDADAATLVLGDRSAICKPRHKTQQAEVSARCQPGTASSPCCG